MLSHFFITKQNKYYFAWKVGKFMRKKAKWLYKYYEMLVFLNKKGVFSVVSRFIKVSFFHTVFEAAITIYTAEIAMYFSSFFLVYPLKTSRTILLMWPIIFSVLATILYTTISMSCFIKTFYNYYQNPNQQLSLKEIIIKTNKKIRRAHLVGVLAYCLCGFLTALFFLLSGIKSSNNFLFYVKVCLLCTTLGIFWNLSGYYRNTRFFYHKLFITKDNPTIVIDNNFNAFFKNAVFSVVALLFVFAFLIVTFLNIHSTIRPEKAFDEYKFFGVYYLSLISIYTKQSYAYIFSSKNEKKKVFPSLKAIINEKNLYS